MQNKYWHTVIGDAVEQEEKTIEIKTLKNRNNKNKEKYDTLKFGEYECKTDEVKKSN